MRIAGLPVFSAGSPRNSADCVICAPTTSAMHWLQNSSRYVEIFTSNREEMERRPLTGGMLV